MGVDGGDVRHADLVGLRHREVAEPLIQPVLADVESGGHVGHLVASFDDLPDRVGLEFFGASLLAHGTSYWASGLRLRGVWKMQGDSMGAAPVR